MTKEGSSSGMPTTTEGDEGGSLHPEGFFVLLRRTIVSDPDSENNNTHFHGQEWFFFRIVIPGTDFVGVPVSVSHGS